MFARKKPFWKRYWFYGLIVVLMGFGVLLNTSFISKSDLSVDASQRKAVQQETAEKEETGETEDAVPDRSGIFHGGTSNLENWEKGYLLLSENGKINLYLITGDDMVFLKETGIVFDLISKADQELFEKGVSGMTESALNDMLQDFES